MKNGERLYYISLDTVMEAFDIYGVTDTSQLNTIGKYLFGDKFIGAVPYDKYDPDIEGYYIVNTHESGMPGEHWFSVVNEKGKKPLVYDSFAQVIIGNGKIPHETTEDDVEQGLAEENCGARSLAWLLTFDLGGRSLARQV